MTNKDVISSCNNNNNNKYTINLGALPYFADIVKKTDKVSESKIDISKVRDIVMFPLHISGPSIKHTDDDYVEVRAKVNNATNVSFSKNFITSSLEEKNMRNPDIATFTIDPKVIHYEYDFSTLTLSATPGFNPEQAKTNAIDIDSIPKDWCDIKRSENYHNLEQTKNTITNDHKKFKDYYTFVVKGIDDTIIETITFKYDSNDNNITYFFPTNDKYQHDDEVEFNASSDNIYNLPYHDIVFNDDERNLVYLKDNSNRLWNLYHHFENGWEIRLAQKYWNKESDNHKFISISDALLNNENFQYKETIMQLKTPKNEERFKTQAKIDPRQFITKNSVGDYTVNFDLISKDKITDIMFQVCVGNNHYYEFKYDPEFDEYVSLNYPIKYLPDIIRNANLQLMSVELTHIGKRTSDYKLETPIKLLIDADGEIFNEYNLSSLSEYLKNKMGISIKCRDKIEQPQEVNNNNNNNNNNIEFWVSFGGEHKLFTYQPNTGAFISRFNPNKTLQDEMGLTSSKLTGDILLTHIGSLIDKDKLNESVILNLNASNTSVIVRGSKLALMNIHLEDYLVDRGRGDYTVPITIDRNGFGLSFNYSYKTQVFTMLSNKTRLRKIGNTYDKLFSSIETSTNEKIMLTSINNVILDKPKEIFNYVNLDAQQEGRMFIKTNTYAAMPLSTYIENYMTHYNKDNTLMPQGKEIPKQSSVKGLGDIDTLYSLSDIAEFHNAQLPTTVSALIKVWTLLRSKYKEKQYFTEIITPTPTIQKFFTNEKDYKWETNINKVGWIGSFIMVDENGNPIYKETKYKITKLSSSGERWDARDMHIRMLDMNAARIAQQEIIDNGTHVPFNIEVKHTKENIHLAFNPTSERYDARDYQVNMLEQNTKETTQKTLAVSISGSVCQINNNGNTINNLYIGM